MTGADVRSMEEVEAFEMGEADRLAGIFRPACGLDVRSFYIQGWEREDLALRTGEEPNVGFVRNVRSH